MTITLQWWLLPVGLVIAAFVVPSIVSVMTPRRDWDFVTPFLCFGIFILFTACAIAVCIGKWLS